MEGVIVSRVYSVKKLISQALFLDIRLKTQGEKTKIQAKKTSKLESFSPKTQNSGICSDF